MQVYILRLEGDEIPGYKLPALRHRGRHENTVMLTDHYERAPERTALIR